MSLLNSCSDDEAAKDDLLGTWTLRAKAMEMIWESPEKVSVEGLSLSTSDIAKLVVEYSNSHLPEELKSITFKNDNKLDVKYFDDDVNDWKTDVYGTYKVKSRKELIYYPDVDKLLKGVDDIGTTTLTEIKVLAATIGVSVKFTLIGPTAAEMCLYLDTKTIKDMKALFPYLLISILGSDVDDIVKKIILEKLPELLEKTNKIEIALYFDKGIN